MPDALDAEQICNTCEVSLPYTDEYWYPKYHTLSKDIVQFQSICKKCTVERNRINLAKLTPEELAVRKENMKLWQKSPHGKKKMREGHLKRKYDITLEDRKDIIEKQGGVCGICEGVEVTKWGRNSNIDHCHDTGEVRGILCVNCNTSLGKLGDSISGLIKAITYLDESFGISMEQQYNAHLSTLENSDENHSACQPTCDQEKQERRPSMPSTNL